MIHKYAQVYKYVCVTEMKWRPTQLKALFILFMYAN